MRCNPGRTDAVTEQQKEEEEGDGGGGREIQSRICTMIAHSWFGPGDGECEFRISDMMNASARGLARDAET